MLLDGRVAALIDKECQGEPCAAAAGWVYSADDEVPGRQIVRHNSGSLLLPEGCDGRRGKTSEKMACIKRYPTTTLGRISNTNLGISAIALWLFASVVH